MSSYTCRSVTPEQCCRRITVRRGVNVQRIRFDDDLFIKAMAFYVLMARAEAHVCFSLRISIITTAVRTRNNNLIPKHFLSVLRNPSNFPSVVFRSGHRTKRAAITRCARFGRRHSLRFGSNEDIVVIWARRWFLLNFGTVVNWISNQFTKHVNWLCIVIND